MEYRYIKNEALFASIYDDAGGTFKKDLTSGMRFNLQPKRKTTKDPKYTCRLVVLRLIITWTAKHGKHVSNR